VNIASRRISGFGSSDRLADLGERNEAVLGSLALRLAGSIHGALTPELLPPLSASLHAGRSVGMMNTFQFIGLVGGAGAPDDTDFRRSFLREEQLPARGHCERSAEGKAEAARSRTTPLRYQ
jgi:hypothetical protein